MYKNIIIELKKMFFIYLFIKINIIKINAFNIIEITFINKINKKNKIN